MDNSTEMIFEFIKFSIIPLVLIIGFILLLYYGHKIIDKVLDVKREQILLDREKLYTTVDPDLVNKTIDDLIKSKIDKYLLDNGIVDESGYITQDTIIKMIHDVSKDIYIHLSDLYKSYILLVTKEVEDENTILKFIRDKVKYQVITIATEINTPKE